MSQIAEEVLIALRGRLEGLRRVGIDVPGAACGTAGSAAMREAPAMLRESAPVPAPAPAPAPPPAPAPVPVADPDAHA